MEEIESVGVMNEEVEVDEINVGEEEVVEEMIEEVIEIEMAVDVQYGLINTDLQQEPIIGLRSKICLAGLAGRI